MNVNVARRPLPTRVLYGNGPANEASGAFLDGLALDEEAFESWLIGERERLHELAVGGLTKLLAHHDHPGGSAEHAVQTAVGLLALDPLRSASIASSCGSTPAKRVTPRRCATYQTCVAVLRRELGAEPDAETERLEGVPSGLGHIAVLVGEAGIGKTRLVEELTALASSRGSVVGIGRCYETEQILPLAPWVQTVRACGLGADEAVRAALPRGTRAALVALLPELDVDVPAAPGNPVRVFDGLLQLVTAEAARRRSRSSGWRRCRPRRRRPSCAGSSAWAPSPMRWRG